MPKEKPVDAPGGGEGKDTPTAPEVRGSDEARARRTRSSSKKTDHVSLENRKKRNNERMSTIREEEDTPQVRQLQTRLLIDSETEVYTQEAAPTAAVAPATSTSEVATAEAGMRYGAETPRHDACPFAAVTSLSDLIEYFTERLFREPPLREKNWEALNVSGWVKDFRSGACTVAHSLLSPSVPLGVAPRM
jgi:hypothetical protein